MKLITLMTTTALLLASCSSKPTTESSANVIGKQEITLANGRITPEALWAMGRIGSVAVSPCGEKILYTVSYYSVKENKSHRTIHLMNADGSAQTCLTTTTAHESQPTWIEGGKKIAFMSNASGTNQVWTMNADGTGRTQLTQLTQAMEEFLFSPDEQKLLFIAAIPYDGVVKKGSQMHDDLDKTTGIIVTDLMHKHWDYWVEEIPHPFVATLNNGKVEQVIDLMEGEPFEAPLRPFGGIEQLAWSGDSKRVAYTSRKKTGREYAISTDSDIYEYNLETKETLNLCKPQPATTQALAIDKSLKGQIHTDQDMNWGYDQNPQYSPNGAYIAWQSMERDGYESDRNRLCILDRASGQKRYVTERFDSNVDDFCWAADNETLYFVGTWHGTTQLYRTNLIGEVTKLTSGQHNYTSVALFGNDLIAKRQAMNAPDDIYRVNPATGEVTQLTTENKHILDQATLGEVHPRWCTTTDGKELLSWIIYPPHFDPTKKYPTLLYCQGGPQSPVSQFWSYRWNMQNFAANDYIIVAPNRRGVPGFGTEWLEQISGDYGGQCMQDYLAAIDDISKESYVDTDRLGCVGASFGGFSVYWLAGHHEKRFKAFISHDGIFNLEQQYLETEEMWFANWDLGGAFWHKNDPNIQRSYSFSPHRFIDKWDTPILCIHGEKDYRILASQGESAFNAAQLRGIPSELLLYPDENHWVLRPQNGILWQRTFINWLDRWLK